MDPQTSGGRFSLPPRVRNSLDLGDGTPGFQVLLCLNSSAECELIRLSLSRRGWTVTATWSASKYEKAVGKFDLVITDDPVVVRFRRMGEDNEPVVFFVSDDHDESLAAAWQTGADSVILRPLDPVNPLGLPNW